MYSALAAIFGITWQEVTPRDCELPWSFVIPSLIFSLTNGVVASPLCQEAWTPAQQVSEIEAAAIYWHKAIH